VPETGSIDLARYRDLDRRGAGPWVKRVVRLVFAAWAILVLFGFIGQHPKAQTSTGPAASLQVDSPTRLRGGLYFQVRITVTAKRMIQNPRLVLDSGWFDGITVNSTIPQASQELSRRDSVVFEYNQLSPGDKLTFWMESQVNPTTVGRRLQSVSLDDGNVQLARVTRHLTIFP
jgi:hypothetical protein